MKEMQTDRVKNITAAAILALLMTFMEMSALPAVLFVDIHFKDIEPVYFALMANFLIAFLLCGICRRFILREWRFGLSPDGLAEGLKKHGLPALIATAAVAASFCIGLYPFDNTPTVWRVLIEGIVYYIGVGVMEELYLRGLLQNVIEKLFGSRRHASLWAVLITSALFGAGHIFGALGQPVLTILCKTVWAAGLGVYLGAVYVKTRNLLLVMVLHTLIDLCGIPFCFSSGSKYPAISLAVSLISFVLLGVYGLFILRGGKKTGETC